LLTIAAISFIVSIRVGIRLPLSDRIHRIGKGQSSVPIVDAAQKQKITLAYVELASAKPEGPRRFRGPLPPEDQPAKPATPPKK
jgi:hypothetical protein